MKTLTTVYLDRMRGLAKMLRGRHTCGENLPKPLFLVYIGIVPVRARSDSRQSSNGRTFPASTRRLQGGSFSRRPGLSRTSLASRFGHCPASSARWRTGENFVGVRHKTSPRRSFPREVCNRETFRRRKACGFRAIRGGRPLAGLRRAAPPSGLCARPFKPRRSAAHIASTLSFNPISHGAPALARSRARGTVGRPSPRRRSRSRGQGQRPRHACKSSQWPTK